MLRALVAVLLVLNGLLLAANLGWIHPFSADQAQREPERLARQVNAEQLRTTAGAGAAWPDGLPASATGGTSASGTGAVGDAPASTAAGDAGVAGDAAASAGQAGAASAEAPGNVVGNAPGSASAAAQGAAPASAAAAIEGSGVAPSASAAVPLVADASAAAPGSLCLQAGPATPAQLTRVLAELRATGLPEGSWRTLALPLNPRYMILMGRYPDENTLRRKMSELDRRKVDWVVLTRAPDIPPGYLPGLSLGRYDDEASANAALARLEARRVNTARVVTLPAVEGQLLLRLPALNPAQRNRVVELAAPANTRWQTCPAA